MDDAALERAAAARIAWRRVPFLIGAIRDATGSFTLSLAPLILFAVVAGLIALGIGQRSPARAAAAGAA